MQEKGSHLFAAETDNELDEWVAALKKAIQSEAQSQSTSQAFLDRMKDKGRLQSSQLC
jgi:hypothetical protein